MKRKIRILKLFSFVGILLLFMTTSCRKVVHLKVNDTEPKLVIEANYDAVQQRVDVSITKTIDVFSSDTFPVIKNAQVQIINGAGVASNLLNNGDGTYTLENYAPQYNTRYKMEVTIDGTSYLASDSLVSVVPIDTMKQEKLPPNPISSDGYAVFVNFQDPAQKNFYWLKIKKNGAWQNDLNDQYLFDDTYNAGSYTQMPLLPNTFLVNDTVTVKLTSYSKQAYDYYYAILSLAGSSTSSPAPANPPQQWSNKALGNFSVFGYDTMQIIIHS